MKKSTILIIGAALLVVVLLCGVLLIALLAGGNDTSRWQPRLDRDRTQWDWHMDDWDMDDWMDGSRIGPFVLALLGLVSCLLVVGGLVLAGVLLARRGRPRSPAPGEPTELQALQRRYARGEISRDQYVARREELGERTERQP